MLMRACTCRCADKDEHITRTSTMCLFVCLFAACYVGMYVRVRTRRQWIYARRFDLLRASKDPEGSGCHVYRAGSYVLVDPSAVTGRSHMAHACNLSASTDGMDPRDRTRCHIDFHHQHNTHRRSHIRHAQLINQWLRNIYFERIYRDS